MNAWKKWLTAAVIAGLSAAVILIDIHSYRNYRDNLIRSEQKQLLMMAETVGTSLKNEIESELEKLDFYFAGRTFMNREDLLDTARQYTDENSGLYSSVSLKDSSSGEKTDAWIAGKDLAESGWYEMEIRKTIACGEGTADIVFMMDLNEIYQRIVAPVKIGDGGYSIVKDKDLAIIMHHARNQIGMDAIYDRREQYPQLDLASLEGWLDLQRSKEEGVSVIDTYVWDDPQLSAVRRIVAFTTIRIRQEEWIVNSTLPMAELDSPLSDMLGMILTLTSVYFVIIAGMLILINRQRIRSEAQEKEISYLQEINQGMEAVAKQNDELRHYQRIESLGMMASHIAHEFNNYLTPVMVYAELMENDPQLSEENRNMVKEIMNSTERAADLSRQLLDFSRQDSGAKLQKMNLRTETEEAVSIVRQLAPAAVTVNTGIMSEDIEVSGRDGMMQHILMNLCKNAFHAMEDSEKKQLDIVLRKAEGGAELQVRDTGSGISRDALERIFEPFYTTKGSRQGTGLGLSVIRNIMHSIGGTIHVESTPGEGTCFTLYFPEVHPGKKTADLRNIVIADHDRDYLWNMEQKFGNRKNPRFEFSSDEMQILSRLRKNPEYCDLVISAYTLKQMNGIDFLETVRRLNPAIRTVLCSESLDADLQWYVNNQIIDRIVLRDQLESELEQAIDAEKR